VCGVVLTATEKSLSNRLSAGRGRRRFSTVNCGRSTKFSKMRSRRFTEDSKEQPEREPEHAEHNPIYNKSDGIGEMLCY
jgi:hypothetical protein